MKNKLAALCLVAALGACTSEPAERPDKFDVTFNVRMECAMLAGKALTGLEPKANKLGIVYPEAQKVFAAHLAAIETAYQTIYKKTGRVITLDELTNVDGKKQAPEDMSHTTE